MNDPNSIVAHRVQAFDQRHGGKQNSVQSSEGSWILYRDGAKREVEPLGALVEPPTEEYELAMAILNYHRARHAHAQAAFNDLKDQLLHSTPDPKALERLKQLKKAAEALREDLDDASAALSRTDRARSLASAQQTQAEQRSRMSAWKSQVRAVAGGAEEE